GRVRGIPRGPGGPRGPAPSPSPSCPARGRPVVGAWADADLDVPRADAPAPGGVAALRPPTSCRGSRGVAPRSDHYLPLDTFPGHPFPGGGAGSPRRGEAGRRRAPRAVRYLGREDRSALTNAFIAETRKSRSTTTAPRAVGLSGGLGTFFWFRCRPAAG